MPNSLTVRTFEAESLASDVSSWLADHPASPGGYEHKHVDDVHSKGVKRSPFQPPRQGVCPLGVIPGNAMASKRKKPPNADTDMPENSTEQSSVRKLRNRGIMSGKGPHGISPQKPASITPKPPQETGSHISAKTGTARNSQINQELGDDEETPRVKALGLIPTFQRPESMSNIPATEGDIEPRDSASQNSKNAPTASSTSRASSPSKVLGNYQLSSVRIETRSLDLSKHKPPADLAALFRDVGKMQLFRKIIPFEVKYLALEDLDIDEEEPIFADANPTANQAGIDGHYEPKDYWSRSKELLEQAFDCQNRGLPESAWNAEVHANLFKLALRGQHQSKGVWYCDITQARIRDRTLLPTMGRVPLYSKMVDYGLIIQPSADMKEKILKRLLDLNMTSINQTEAECVLYDPITVSIETKKSGHDEAKGIIQLSTWISAQYAKLARLAPQAASLPSLPMILTQGHDWYLLAAESRSPTEIVIFRELRLGDTRTMLGVYQILAAIKRLACWILEDYIPWFERVVLDGGNSPLSE